MGTQWHPNALHLQADKLYGLADLELFSRVKVQFKQPHNAIAFPQSLLRLPLRHRVNDNLSNQEQAYESLYLSSPATDFTGSLRQLIKEHLKEGYFNVTLAAQAAGMSTRSLQRYLTAEGLSYSRLVDQVRFDLAMIWLQQPTLQLNDIAFELGYREPANFTRAFKRWTGISPTEFRRSL
jgi:AraC-like DNA-binding protein